MRILVIMMISASLWAQPDSLQLDTIAVTIQKHKEELPKLLDQNLELAELVARYSEALKHNQDKILLIIGTYADEKKFYKFHGKDSIIITK